MLNRALLDKTLTKVSDLRGLVTYGSRATTHCYRSRIPFISDATAYNISLLLMLCAENPEQWMEIAKTTTSRYKRTSLSIDGICTERSATYTVAQIAAIPRDYRRPGNIGTQVLLVNVTNKAQYPIILNYINQAPEATKVFQTTASYAGKPVEYVCARFNYPDGEYNSVAQYVVFTTLWDYNLNLSLVYTALNHLLTTTTDVPECDRTVKFRAGYSWFQKFFEGTDVTEDILAYFDREYVSKLEDARKAAIASTLQAFERTKVSVSNNITAQIRDYHQRIQELERKIDDHYKAIQRLTITKLTETDNLNMLAVAIKIFEGMLNQGVLTGFNYKATSDTLRRFSWRVRLPITYWEDDEAKHWLNTLQGHPYKLALFKAMFIDRLVKPWCEQYMTIDLSGDYRMCTNSSGNAENDDCIYPPHPHVGRYNCFGNNATEVERAINNKDVGTAITVCMNAVMQLNMTDYTVTSWFLRQVVPDESEYSNTAFLEYRGMMYTPAQLKDLYSKEGGFNNGETNQVTEGTEEASA